MEEGNEQAMANRASARKIVEEGYERGLVEALKELKAVEVAASRIPVPMPLGLNRRGKLANGSATQAWGAGPLNRVSSRR